MIEIVAFKDVAQPQTPQNVSESSEFDYGSDMSRPLDLTSPVTSPEVKVSELPKSNTDSKEVDNSQQEPTADVLPTLVSESLHSEDGGELDSEDNESNSNSGDSAVDDTKEQPYEEDSESEESDDDNYESNDLVEQEPPAGVQTPFRFMGPPKVKLYAPGTTVPQPPFAESVQSSAQPDLTVDVNEPASSLPEQHCPDTDAANYTTPWSEYLMPRIASPSEKAMAKPMGIPTPGYHSYDYQSRLLQNWANNQGPSHSYYSYAAKSTDPYGSITANESFPFGPHRSSTGYLRHLANDLLGEQMTNSNEKPLDSISLHQSYSTEENSSTAKDAEKSAETSKTRLSIADIVEKSAVHNIVPNKLKRKADEFEAHLETGDTEDSIPDAQPRPDIQNIELSQPQVLDADSTNIVRPDRMQEHRHKRVKTKEVHNFMKYVTVAAIGAVVGSIGTIAGLASLPADFFN